MNVLKTINHVSYVHDFSKDPGIEDRIQLSLRENLKDIGQRCIQELRDYIEKLRTEQQEEAV